MRRCQLLPFINGKMPFDFGASQEQNPEEDEEEKMKPEMEITWVQQQRQKRVWRWSNIPKSWHRRRNSRNQRAQTPKLLRGRFDDLVCHQLKNLFLLIDWMLIFTSHICEYAWCSILPYSSTHQRSRCEIRTGLFDRACPQRMKSVPQRRFSTF